MARPKTNTSAAEQLIAGIQKHFPTAGSLAFDGGAFTPAQVEASVQTLIDLRTSADAAKTAAKSKLTEESTQAPSLRRHTAAFVLFVRATFGNSPDVLADFGLKPRKAMTPLTIEQKAVSAARGKATRVARHTMGTQQKKQIKGTITTIVTPLATGTSSPPT